MSLSSRSASWFVAFAVMSALGCASIPRQNPASLSFWLAPMPGAPGGGAFLSGHDESEFEIGETISIDTVSFRPSTTRPAYPKLLLMQDMAMFRRFAIVTNYQGTRYHPETIRALAEDTIALASVAGALANEANQRGAHTIVADFQGLSQSDLTGLLTTLRALNDSGRRNVVGLLRVIVPPGDTVAYPTRAIAATARTIVVRLYGEHRPGTGPGALASPEWINRQLGLRAVDVGAKRLMAELPLFGYLWQRDSAARPISYVEASRIVTAEGTTFRRDQPTGFLTATGRDGWSVWIPDAQTVEKMIGVVRRAGLSEFILTGMDGADPDLWTRLPALRR